MSTKNHILLQSKLLFFEQGIANTRLQQIADAAGISVGNLAYHYKNKEAIVEAVYENLFEELATILSQYGVHTGFEGFDKQFSDLYFFFTNNQFTFNNNWEIDRNHPEIQSRWLSLNTKILSQLKQRISRCVQIGLIKPEPFKGEHELLCQHILIIVNHWIPQQILRKKPVLERLYKKSLWSLLYPSFTSKGQATFDQVIVPNSLL
jgi:AcrR family transcriptional regulator